MKLLISTTCLLVGIATSLFNLSAYAAQNQAQGSKELWRPSVVSFECQAFSQNMLKIVLKKNKTYTVQSLEVNNDPTNTYKTLPGGRYVSFRKGFRFKTGELKNQSILREDNNIFLLETSDEARAVEVAAGDGAAFCKKI